MAMNTWHVLPLPYPSGNPKGRDYWIEKTDAQGVRWRMARCWSKEAAEEIVEKLNWGESVAVTWSGVSGTEEESR